jgi:hypothetical protein
MPNSEAFWRYLSDEAANNSICLRPYAAEHQLQALLRALYLHGISLAIRPPDKSPRKCKWGLVRPQRSEARPACAREGQRPLGFLKCWIRSRDTCPARR